MSLHVECGQAGFGSRNGTDLPVEIANSLAWSETVTTAGTTSNEVPRTRPGTSWVLTLTAEVDMWVAIGAIPNATAGNSRRRLKAGTMRSFSASGGMRVAWAA